MTEDKALTVRQKRASDIERAIEDRTSKLLEVMPKGMDANRFVRTTLTAVARDSALLECTPESLVLAIFEAAECGIEPTGSLGRGYLVPIKDHGVPKAEFWIGYPGLIELAMRSERVSKVWSRPVFKGDTFEVRYGTRDEIIHDPQLGAEVKAAELTHVYACVRYKDGAVDFEVLTKEQCDLVRARARGASSPTSPWNTDYIEQCRKTSIRKLGKRMPLTAESARAIQRDEEREFGFEARRQETVAEKRADALGETLRAKAGRKTETVDVHVVTQEDMEAEAGHVSIGPSFGSLVADTAQASEEPAETFHGQGEWPCRCGHRKDHHYFGDDLGADGRMHTWCQTCAPKCSDFRPSESGEA